MFSQESFREWTANPLTQEFFQFLKDQQSDLAQRWAAGEAMDLQAQTKALLLGEMASLEWKHLASFYGPDEPDDDPAR